MRSRGFIVAVVGLVVVAVLLAATAVVVIVRNVSDDDATLSEGVSDSASPSESPSGSDGAGDGGEGGSAGLPDDTSPDLVALYEQDVQWESCGDAHECGDVEVPLDYDDPGGETFTLALLKVPAKGEKVGSLVVNPGGPGAPGTSYAAQAASVFRDPLLQSFDIVGFDPRGTGDSSPVDCLSDSELDAYLAADPDPDTPAEERESKKFLEDFGTGCVANSGDIADHVTTVEAARDMDIIRAVLGESTLDYFGASYGTKLGATYAQLFPDNAGRLVLDGALDTTLDPRDLALQQAAGFETALRSYVADCVEGADCYLGGSVDAGIERIQEFLADIDAEPLKSADGRQVTSGSAFYGIITPLYNTDYWPLLTTALQAAFDGDGAALQLLADAYASRNPDGSFADNSMEANFTINCLDDPRSIPFDDVKDQFGAFEKASPTFGRSFAYALASCSDFDGKATVKAPVIDGAGAPPILVVGTTRDPATPYRWAKAMASQLESAVLLTRDGDGHTGYNAGNECVDTTIESYLIDDKVPDGPVSC